MAARYAVGVDIGGTKILAGVISLETGAVVSSARKRTHPERGADFFSKRLLDVVTAALDEAKKVSMTWRFLALALAWLAR